MKIIKQSSFLFLCLITMLTLSHCTEDDGMMEPEEDLINLNDANALAEAVSVTGASVVTGTPPAPSTDPSAPEIFEADDTFGVQGGEIQIGLDLGSGDAAGVYLVIPGADSYFDIPASAFTGGRTEQVYPEFFLELPDNIQPGEFCVQLCVYDSEARVSNIVEKCITVGELGGANAEFLIGLWSITKIVDTYDGMTDTQIIGEPDVSTYSTNLTCADGMSFQEVEVEEYYLTEVLDVTFSENGALLFVSEGSDKFLDYTNSTCEDLVYTMDEYSDSYDGAWSYTDATKRLVLIINEDDDDEGEIEQEVVEMTISVNGNTMEATQEYDDGDGSTVITFVKQ